MKLGIPPIVARRQRQAATHPSKRRVFYGWWMVGTGFAADFVNVGTGTFALGVLLVPMQEALGVGRTALSFALTIRTIVSGVVSPFVGPLIDKVGGARVVMAGGSFLGGLGLILTGLVNANWQFLLAFGVLGGAGMVASGTMVTTALISKWFVRLRGRAVAIATMGVSSGGLAMAPLTQFLLDSLSWRHAWVILGLFSWFVILPLALLVVRTSPESMGLRPDGEPPDDTRQPRMAGATLAPSPRKASEEAQWTRREALSTPTFWILVAAFSIGGAEISGLLLHSRSYLAETMTPRMATWAFTLAALGGLLGKPVWGYLIDKVQIRWCLGSGYLIAALAVVLFLRVEGNLTGFTAAFTYGLGASGMAPLQGVVWANYYGRSSVGSIRGIVTPFSLAASATGPLLAGWIFDTTGSYRIAFYIFLGQALAASALAFMAKPPPKRPAPVLAGP